MNDLVLLSSGDLSNGISGFSGLSAHVSTLGETTELYRMLVSVGLNVYSCGERTYSLDDHAGDLVRVGVGRGPAVLEVTLALLGAGTVDTDGGTTVGDTPGELVI